jgi:hypothetical protein
MGGQTVFGHHPFVFLKKRDQAKGKQGEKELVLLATRTQW